MNFSERLKQIIESKGISPYELSMRTKVSQATLSRILGKSTIKPSIKTIDALAKYLHVNSEWLLTGNGPMECERNCTEPNQTLTNMDVHKLIDSLERKDRQFDELLDQNSRLISVIEKLSGTIKQSQVG